MIVPDWPKYIPGILLCILFAFVVMNIDHALEKYHKADAASEKLPKLEKELNELTSSGADPQKITAIESQIQKSEKALASS